MKQHTLGLATCVTLAVFAPRIAAQEIAEIRASDEASRDHFALALAMDGDTLVVGSSEDDDAFANSGSVYVYVGAGPNWVDQAKLRAPDPRANDNFGSSVAICGDTLAVGAYRDDLVNGSNQDEGAVFVFVRSAGAWAQQATLQAADAALRDQFGFAVAIDSDTIAVGVPHDDDSGPSSGAVYVFFRTGATWVQQAKLVSGDAGPGDHFGGSVAVHGDRVVVGAQRADVGGLGCGASYVFERTGGTWTQIAKLAASDPTENDLFGRSIAVDGDRIVVGASQDDDLGLDSGSAYVFAWSGANWVQQAKLRAWDGAALDNFGRSVDLAGGTLIVGACGSEVSRSNGQAYVFAQSASGWTPSAKLTATETAAADFFGISVALSGATAVVGSAWDDDAGPESGSCHVFWVHPVVSTYCTAKTTSSGCTPALTFAGVPSATSGASFLIAAEQVESNKAGLLYYGVNGPRGTPFQGGFMCVEAPTQRTPTQNSGASGGPPCVGVLALDLNTAGICSTIGVGNSGWMQGWFRDPAAASTTGLTNAIQFAVAP